MVAAGCGVNTAIFFPLGLEHRSNLSRMLRKFSFAMMRSSNCSRVCSSVRIASTASVFNCRTNARVSACAACASVIAGPVHAPFLQARFWHVSASAKAKASSDSTHSNTSADNGSSSQKSATYRGKTSNGVIWEYAGEVDNKGRKDGAGTCSWDNGDTYHGQWKCDEKQGRGIYKWPDGKVYDGEWQRDKAEGLGKMTYPDGAVYEGAWVEGYRCGYGVATWPSGMLYEGEWRDGKRNGQGKLTAKDGSVYSGEWSDGVPHGNGEKTFPGGKVDRGVWRLGNKV